MKASYRAQKPRTRQVLFDVSKTGKRSIWSEAAKSPHVIVAGVGSLALIGLAGSAIWMMLPQQARTQMIAKATVAETVAAASEQAIRPALPASAPAKPAPFAKSTALKPAGTASPQDVQHAKASSQAYVKAPARTRFYADAQAVDFSPLDATDPRWAGKMRSRGPAAQAKISGGTTVAAYAADESEARKDKAATGAISPVKPQWPITTETADPDDGTDDATSGGRPGRIYTGANLRSKPGGRVVSTVPARSDVRVISCNLWCEIVYKGRRGYVYKSFLSGNTRIASPRRKVSDPTVANAANDDSSDISAVKPPAHAEIKTIDSSSRVNNR